MRHLESRLNPRRLPETGNGSQGDSGPGRSSVSEPPAIRAAALALPGRAVLDRSISTSEIRAIRSLLAGSRFLRLVEDLGARGQAEEAAFRESGEFVRFGVVAAREAARIAGLDWGIFRATRSVFCATEFGGAGFAQAEERVLLDRGPLAVSKYLSTGWFPASLAGHASILCGAGGPSRTVTSSSGAVAALFLALNAIRVGAADEVLVAAADCAGDRRSRNPNASAARESTEGVTEPAGSGCALVLGSSREVAPRVLSATVRGGANSCGAEATALACIESTLAKAGLRPEDIDVVVDSGQPSKTDDSSCLRALRRLLAECHAAPFAVRGLTSICGPGAASSLAAVSVAGALLLDPGTAGSLERLSGSERVHRGALARGSDFDKPRIALVLAGGDRGPVGSVALALA